MVSQQDHNKANWNIIHPNKANWDAVCPNMVNWMSNAQIW